MTRAADRAAADPAARPIILLLEDSDIDAELIAIHLERAQFDCDIVRATRRSEFERALDATAIDLVLADYSLPDFDGLEALAMTRARFAGLPFVFVSGVGGEEIATDALRRGATDYVLKRNLARLVGSIQRALAEARERAQRERAEGALFRSEARMRLAVDAAELGMWHYSADDASFGWDMRCQRLFGLDGRDAVGYDEFLARVLPADRDALDAALQAALRGDASVALSHECRSLAADGSLRWVVIRGQKLASGEAAGVRLTGVLQDVTATRRLEARQRQAEMLFRIAAQATGVGIWELGPGPDDIWVDESFRAMAALPPDSGFGYADLVHRVVHPDDRARVDAAAQAALGGVGDAEIDIEARLVGVTDRRMRWIALKGRRIVGIDGQVRLVGTVRDVTEQRALQQALRDANQELELRVAERTRELTAEIRERGKVEDTLHQMQRLEAVGQLTSGVAHDFNNLLTIVLNNLTLVDRLLAQRGTVEPRVADRLAAMRTAANRGATLTRQLLAFSRRQRLEPQTVNFNEIISGMRDLLQTTLGGSVNLQTELADDLWPALADPTQIEMVVLNLAINARDAMEVGGSLEVQTANRTLVEPPSRPEAPEPGDYVVLSVTDTGSGMSDEVLAKAFEPFFTTKEIGKGSGLGLAQVFGFAKQSGGGARIETRAGHGTSVHVYLPRSDGRRADAVASATVAAVPSPARFGSTRALLLVDDDDAVREATAALLSLHGFRIIEAADGVSALAQARARDDIDAVIADFAMPRMNGAELARQLRTLRPDLPVLFMTGFAELGALDDVPEDFVLQKPIAENELVARLDRLLPG